MIGAAIGRGNAKRYPGVAVVVGKTVNRVCSSSRIGCESPAGQLVGPKNRIQSGVGRNVRLIFPQRFAALWFRRRLSLTWSQAPNRADVHHHDASAVRIESNVELALSGLRGRTARCLKDLVARNANRGRVSSAKVGIKPARARQQFNPHMDEFLGGRVRNNLY